MKTYVQIETWLRRSGGAWRGWESLFWLFYVGMLYRCYNSISMEFPKKHFNGKTL
jgi:hypothetical protein